MPIYNFTVEETNLVAIYRNGTRSATVAEIAAALPYMESDIQRIAENAIQKLNSISEEDYAALSFDPAEETDG